MYSLMLVRECTIWGSIFLWACNRSYLKLCIFTWYFDQYDELSRGANILKWSIVCLFNSYQMVDFRVGSRRGAKNLPIKAKRDTSSFILPNLVGKNASQGSLVKEAVMVSSENKPDDKQSEAEQDLPYVFTPNKMPKQKQLFYQVCDLHDPEIQTLVSKNDGQVCYNFIAFIQWSLTSCLSST